VSEWRLFSVRANVLGGSLATFALLWRGASTCDVAAGRQKRQSLGDSLTPSYRMSRPARLHDQPGRSRPRWLPGRWRRRRRSLACSARSLGIGLLQLHLGPSHFPTRSFFEPRPVITGGRLASRRMSSKLWRNGCRRTMPQCRLRCSWGDHRALLDAQKKRVAQTPSPRAEGGGENRANRRCTSGAQAGIHGRLLGNEIGKLGRGFSVARVQPWPPPSVPWATMMYGARSRVPDRRRAVCSWPDAGGCRAALIGRQKDTGSSRRRKIALGVGDECIAQLRPLRRGPT